MTQGGGVHRARAQVRRHLSYESGFVIKHMYIYDFDPKAVQ